MRTALNQGLIQRIYQGKTPDRLLQAYIGDYLKAEIASEALTRNIPAFSRFLEIASLSNGEIINYNNIAAECGVSAPTVKEYFQILSDTVTGKILPAFRKKAKIRIILTPKFYFFDVGIVSHLAKCGNVLPGSELFGRAFEHFIFMEITANSSYSERFYPSAYWRTASGFEVDYILGGGEIAVEVKPSAPVQNQHMRGIRAFKEEQKSKRYSVVSTDPEPRKTSDGIEIMPWKYFLDNLWDNNLL